MAEPTLKDVLAALAKLATKDDVTALEKKMATDLNSVRLELIAKIATARAELREDIQAVANGSAIREIESRLEKLEAVQKPKRTAAPRPRAVVKRAASRDAVA